MTGTGDLRESAVSTGYAGATGNANVFLTTGGTRFFEISGISTLTCTDLVLSFGAWKQTSASDMTELIFEFSTDGISYTSISIPPQPTGSGTANWRLITLNLPLAASNQSNLRLRWTNTETGTSPQFRIDDISLSGTCGTPNTITASNLSTTSFTIDCTTNDAGTIDLTSTGTFNAGNDYDIQLSDAAGTFTSPIIIGTLASTSNSENNIVITIPAGTTSSTNYAIRIVSTNPAVISNILSPISITLTGGPCVASSYNCGTIIWFEDFENYADGVYSNVQAGAQISANNNTVNPNADWICHGNNCDGDGNLGITGGNFFGVSTNANGNKEFRVNDIEGISCCGSQGENDNYWITEEIDISGYSSISIAISARVEGDVECTTCGTGRDEFNASYSTDGGTTWSVPFYTICGATSGFTEVNCIEVTGSTLMIRVLLGNQANDENYFFDDIIVCEASCNVLLPVEIHSFYGEYDAYKSANTISWISESETNNEKYILLHSIDGKTFEKIGTVPGSGTTSTLLNYSLEHRNPTPGINYYKLKSVDYDGTVHDKGIIAVQVEMNHVFYDQITRSIQLNHPSDYAVYGSDGRLITRTKHQQSIPFEGFGMYVVIDERTGQSFKLGIY
jgi:hypothetical protein